MRKIRELLALVGLIGAVLLLAVNWRAIPALMPVHFGLNGEPNRFASKQELWWIVGIGVFVYTALLLVGRFPRSFNLPAPRRDPDRARQETIARELIAWLRLETAWIFAYVIWGEVEIAHGARIGLGFAPIVVLIVIVFVTCAIFLTRLMNRGNS